MIRTDSDGRVRVRGLSSQSHKREQAPAPIQHLTKRSSTHRLRGALAPLVCLGLCFPTSAVWPQGYAPSETDLAVAYCLGVHRQHTAEADEWSRPICDGAQGQVAAICRDASARDEQRRLRLVRYLASRGYFTQPLDITRVRLLNIQISNGENDAVMCTSQFGASCGHCSSRRGLDAITSCSRSCSRTVPACTRVQRCEDGDLLRAVP